MRAFHESILCGFRSSFSLAHGVGFRDGLGLHPWTGQSLDKLNSGVSRVRFRTLSGVSSFGGDCIMNKIKSASLAAVAGLSLVSAQAFAVAQVYTGLTVNVTDEIAAAMPVVLAVGGILLGIGVAFRLIKRAGKF